VGAGVASDASPGSEGSDDVREQPGGRASARSSGDDARERRLFRAALVLSLLPLAVSAVALVLGVGGGYKPSSDHALTELQIRDIGRHPVLVGLYSRGTWSHPGPLLFYVLAPFYWLTGGAAIGMNLGSLAVNGGAIAGMAALARRRGGAALAVCVLLACALFLRTVGGEFAHDPWNCFVPTLPFAAMVLVAWAMACGDAWALPVGAAVASFLAQAHVGFVALALPLLGWGAAWLVVPAAVGAWRDRRGTAPDRSDPPDELSDGDAPPGGRDERRRVWRAAALATGVLVLLWLPPLIDVLVNAPSNVREIVEWFTSGDEQAHTLGEGWRVVTAQLALGPEWIAGKRPFTFGSGESPYLGSAPLPVLLVPAVAAAVALWRWAGATGRRLVLTLALTLVLSIVAVARTVGPAFDYRLRWTWVPGMLIAATTAWAGWRALDGSGRRRLEQAARVLVVAAVAGLGVLSAVNTVAAVRAGTPQSADSDIQAQMLDGALDALPDGDGQVVVSDVFHNGAWYARGLVLALERRGVDARVPRHNEPLFGEHRVVDPDRPVRAHFVVGINRGIADLAEHPDLELVTEWTAIDRDRTDEIDAELARLDADRLAGRVGEWEYAESGGQLARERHGDSEATAWAVAVFRYPDPPRHG
jgi:hypothetical protein